MTTVADFGEYTGEHGAITYGGAAIADCTVDIKWNRDTVTVPRANHISDLNRPGKLKISTFKIGRVQIDAALMGASLTAAGVTGTAGVVHAGLTPPGSGAENITDMTSVTPATPSKYRFIPRTAPITAGGYAILTGTDVNGNAAIERLDLTACVIGATSATSLNVFKTVTNVALLGTVAAGGTIEVSTIVGSATYTPDDPKVFDIIFSVTRGVNSMTFTAPDCWFTEGGVSLKDLNPLMEDIGIAMRDPELLSVV